MGSWNHTCAATFTPIVSGDPVLVFVLCQTPARKGGGADPLYATSLWQPLALPMPAIYDGYGTATLTSEGAAIFNAFHNALPNAFIVDGSDRDAGRPDLDMATLFQRQARKGCLWMRSSAPFFDPGHPGLRVGLMMVHQAVYDGLSQSALDEDRTPFTPDTIIHEAGLLVDSLIALFGPDAAPYPHLTARHGTEAFFPLLEPQWGSLMVPGVRGGIASLFPSIGRALADPAAAHAGDAALRAIASMLVFHRNFEDARRVYAPSLSSGQDDHPQPYRILATIADAIVARLDAHDDDDLDA